MADAKYYLVKNRSASSVCYRIQEDGIRRTFAPSETKRISFEELNKLTYQPGGREIMANFLQIQADEVLNELGIPVEDEYYMNEAQIIDLIKNGSIEAFLDCLDYAPVGVIDLLKSFAVKLPLEDLQKRTALKEKTGFDVDKAIANARAEMEDAGNTAVPVATGDVGAAAAPARRTKTNYKVTNIEKKPTE